MLTLLAWSVFIAGFWSFAFFKLSAKFWLPLGAALLLIYSYFHWFSYVSLIILWGLWLGAAVLLCLPTLRKTVVTMPLRRWFRAQQPQLTDVEQQVLDAGGLWFEKEFFSGDPNWKHLWDIPKPALNPAEADFINQQVDTLCSMLDDWEIVHDKKDLPETVWAYLKQEKFFGLVIDKKYGGHGFSALGHSTVVTKIASRSYSAALTVMVPNSLGPAEFLERYGTAEQKNYYLPRLANGEEIPCFALTGTDAGSDATSITDEGIVCKAMFEGQEVIGVRLNWDKRYITLAPVATLIGLAFKMYDPDHLLGEQTQIGITLALIPANHPGVDIGKRHYPLNLAFMNGPIRGKDVFIPLDWIIGGKERRGHGWQMMMECLAVGRGISLPALSAATTQICYRMTGAYALIRRQFNRAIGDFEGVKLAMARIGGMTYLCEAARWFTAQAVQSGARPAVASAITKYHLTEMSRRAVVDAMDIHAGRGVQTGPRNYLGNIYDGMPISITVEGANILTRNLIIFGQGVMRCHPFLREEIASAKEANNKKQQKQFDRLIVKHIGFVISQVARAIVYGVTGGRWIQVRTNGKLAKCYQQLTRMSNALMLLTDFTLLVMGGQLKIKEALSARLGDIVSYLYLGTAALKYAEDHDASPEDTLHVEWAVQFCLAQMSRSINKFIDNFPIRWLGRLLQRVIFPWGARYPEPADSMSMQIADTMQQESAWRERLTQYCYTGKDAQDLTGRMEITMHELLATQPIIMKVEQAIRAKKIKPNASLTHNAELAFAQGILSAAELEQLKQMEQLRRDAIKVDEF